MANNLESRFSGVRLFMWIDIKHNNVLTAEHAKSNEHPCFGANEINIYNDVSAEMEDHQALFLSEQKIIKIQFTEGYIKYT